MNDIADQSTRELLIELIGTYNATMLYTTSLRPLFCVEESAPMYKKVGLRRAQRKLIVARELVTRCFAEQLRDCDLMTNPELVRTYLTAQFAPLEREVFACLYLDTRHRIIGNLEVLFRGTIDAATVHPREVVKAALRRNAAAIILAHNHPSGVTEPSPADRALTRRLIDALALIDVRVIDHMVVGAEGATSFAERGWL